MVGWEDEWIETARKLVQDEFERSYAGNEDLDSGEELDSDTSHDKHTRDKGNANKVRLQYIQHKEWTRS